jgi:hypothetical protein
MRTWRSYLGAAAVLFCLAPSALAILSRLTPEDDGKKATIDVKRLEALSPAKPKEYRDYAEELAAHQGDPEARYMAQRLFLIAAYLAPKELGSSCMLRMSALASSTAEARKYRAMAFLLDPGAGPDILKVPAPKPAVTGQPDKAQARLIGEVVTAVHQLRSGQIEQAIESAKRQGMDKVLSLSPDKIDQKTFLKWCADASCPSCKATGKMACPVCNRTGVVPVAGVRPPRVEPCPKCSNGKNKGSGYLTCTECEGSGFRDIPASVDRQLVNLELWALEQQAGGESKRETADPASWSAALQATRSEPVLPLTLETISEFDPRKCLYRNGKFVAE